ncbi:MAG: polysaccharide deacetylase [Flavobacteriaceae bacterium]|nr:MAG: polysaccharide deacetylase [Flavobacteriaceae bacterium]
MKSIRCIFFLLLFILLGCKNQTVKKFDSFSIEKRNSKPIVSFTFDDGITSDIANFKFEEWNEMILSHLENENLKAIFFVTGRNKLNKKGQFLLQSWNDKGHKIANHSFSHPYFNSDKNNSHLFELELLRTDTIISKFSNNIKFFRFPYLKEGQNKAKVDSLRTILSKHNYQNGYVTIDASDWYVNQRLIERIGEIGAKNADIEKYKAFYIKHIMERANYYEALSYAINDRHINHTLLLHHNLTSALFLGDLIQEFKAKGWEVVHADVAYKDPIFKTIPDANFAGESLIYSMVKQLTKYDHSLRYPAEDSRYEKEKMNKLGL